MIAAAPHDPARRLPKLRILRGELERLGTELFDVRLGQRRLVRGRPHVRGEDTRVCVVEDRGFDAAPQQLVGLAHEELVERVLGRHQHRQAAAAPAGAPPLLPERRNRAREADRDHAVEQSHVDAQLERVGGADAEQVAVEQPPLDLPPLCRRVARPVRGEVRVVAEALGGEPVDQLGRLPALGEGERPQSALDEQRLELRGFGERGTAQAELGVEQRRVPEDDGALGPRRPVVGDERHAVAEQLGSELARVRDRRRGEQQLRVGPVDAREPAEPPNDVRDVRPEHAAVHVRLVEHDVAQIREDVSPPIVVREHADVQHVRVREDDVGATADLAAVLGRRVSVVDRSPHAGQSERVEGAKLVLRERLRRVEEESAELRIAGERVEHRQVERERLPRCSARRDADVLTSCRCLPERELVRVEGRNGDRLPHGRCECLRQAGERGGPFMLDAEVRDLLALEEPLEAQDVDAHRCARSAIATG